MIKNKKITILLIGSYPPPFGGISVHIERLHQYLVNNGDECKILHTGHFNSKLINNKDVIRLFEIFSLFKIKKINPIVHIHVSAISSLLKIYLLSLFFRDQKKIITIHSGTFVKKIDNQSRIKYLFLRLVLRTFNYIIAVNAEQKKLLINKLSINNDKVVVIPAFIYPTSSSIEFDNEDISLIEQSIKIKITMSGYLRDYYGYDLIIDYLENNQNHLGFFIFYGNHDEEYKNRIISRIKYLDNAYFYNDLSPSGFNWLLKNSDVYVRNTDRDGDSVAIREAIYWGLKVCATNVVDRPRGTELFSFNNKFEFENAIHNVVNQPNAGKIAPGINYANNIYEVYESLTQ